MSIHKTNSKSKLNNILKAGALEFAECEIPVFPCQPRGKTPLTRHGFKDATGDPSVVEAWWEKWPDANVGIPTGAASGLFAIDVDMNETNGTDGEASLRALEAEHGSLPITWEVSTGGGGRHIWFYCPEGQTIGNSVGRLGPGLDIRGEGGYVIAPPSIHPTGRAYAWTADGDPANADPAEAPQWLIELLVTGEDRAISSDENREKIPKGRRNDTLFGRARSLYAKGMSEAEVREAIRRENAKSCDPPLPDGEVDGLLKSAARYRNDSIASDARPAIRVEQGERHRMADEAEQALIADPGVEIYEHAGRLVSPIKQRRLETLDGVTRERGAMILCPASSTWLADTLTRGVRFLKWDGRQQRDKLLDCPAKVATTLLARQGRWHFPLLEGVVECPTIRPDGSVLDQAGYDQQSGLLMDFDGGKFPRIPANPSHQQAKEALEFLKTPLAGFPFVSEADKSVALAAILTAPVRRSLRSAPLFAITAPTMGAGKTLLANTVSLIASGRDAAVMSQARSREEDQKRLLSILLANDLIIIIDNVERPLGGDALCAIMTQPSYRDRLLGESTAVTVPTNAMFIATGNNLSLYGDITRRTLLCTIDPRCERPDERRFDVNLRQYILAHRSQLVGAVLTVLRAYIVAGKPNQNIQAYGSFEQWSDLVRSALVWLGEADPLDSRKKIEDADPVRRSLEAVLSAWWNVYEDKAMTMAKLIGEISDATDGVGPLGRLRAALVEAIGDERGALNAQKAAKWAQRVEGRIAGGLKLQRSKKTSSGIWKWQVIDLDQPTTGRDTGVAGGEIPAKQKNAPEKRANGETNSSTSVQNLASKPNQSLHPQNPSDLSVTKFENGTGGASCPATSNMKSNGEHGSRNRGGSQAVQASTPIGPNHSQPAAEPQQIQTSRTFAAMSNAYPVKLMIDSGAYSAWKLGIRIDLDEYISYGITSQPYVDTIVNLDVIPGEYGREPKTDEVEQSAKQGYANLKRMEQHGLSPIPVFHEGEDFHWLERYRDEGYLYIGISPRKYRGEATRRWIADCFELLAKCNAGQTIRTHAFGMTNFDWLVEFPWYSCDSSSWRLRGAYGGIHLPHLTWPERSNGNNEPNSPRYRYVPYMPRLHRNERYRLVKVTDRSGQDRCHYDNLSPEAQRDTDWSLKFTTGFNREDLKDCDIARAAANVRACRSVERYLKRVHGDRFGHLIYATNLNASYNAVLSGILISENVFPSTGEDDWFETPNGFLYGVPCGYFQPNRLLSYWWIRKAKKDKDPDFLRRFVTTGLMDNFEVMDKLGEPFQPRLDPRRPQI